MGAEDIMTDKSSDNKNGIAQNIKMILLLIATILIPLLFMSLHIEVYAISCITTFLSCSFMKKRYTTIICFVSYLCFLWSVFWKLYSQWGESVWNQAEFKYFAIEVICLTIEFTLVYILALFIINVAQRVIHEREMLYKEKLLIQQKIEMQSDFLAHMSHEIRTPINAVLSINEMLLQETKEQRTENYASKIRVSALHLLNYVSNVLDYSKIEGGKLEIVKKKFESTTLLKELIDIYQLQASSKGVSFHYHITSDVPRCFMGDEMRIRQVYANILSNAVKYTDEGSIKLEVSFEKTEDTKGNLICVVTDTGTGIRSEDMERLFSSYSRFNLEKNNEIQGSGLGLKICKQTLELMGGTIDVQSEYGRGTSFIVIVPMEYCGSSTIGDFSREWKRLEIKGRKEAKGNGLGTIQGANVLIVDDNEINLQVAEAILKKTGCNVVCLDSGQACLEQIYKEHYDLLLLDHMMPEIDGLAVLKEMRNRDDHCCVDTKIVVLTANAVSGAKNQYMELGFDDYISKPISIKELDRVIARLLPEFYKVNASSTGTEETDNYNEDKAAEYLQYHIDTEKALEFFDGDYEQYISTIRIFVEDYEKRIEKLGIAMEEENLNDYAILVHGLKGNSRTLGAMQLGELAFEEEKAAKAGDVKFLQEHQYELGKEWKLVMDGFTNLLSDTDNDANRQMEDSDISGREFEDRILTTMACLEGEQFTQAKTILEELLKCNMGQAEESAVRESLKYCTQENVAEAMKCLNKVWRGE